jgi:ABC-type Fe3+/spermidine/putrescine transport system ATPase subunit
MVAEFIGETNLINAKVLTRSAAADFFDVQTAFGTLRARVNQLNWQPEPGTEVILSIRPEALTFGHVRDSPNCFPGHIVDTIYLGTTAQYELQLYNGPLMKVCEMNPTTIRKPSSEETRLMAAPADVVMLPR